MRKDLYRSRLKTPLDQNALKFLSSLKEDLWIVEEDIIGTEVHNIMLYKQNIINESEIKQILQALENLKNKFLANEITLDENFEDIHPFIEKSIIDRIGINVGGKIHTGRSRNDQISVDIRLKIRDNLNEISRDLFSLYDILVQLSKDNLYTYMPLYTHLQSGQLGVFSHYLNYYISQILRSLHRIEEVYNRVNMNPLGACAIGGTSINIDRIITTELLGFNDLVYNSIDAVSSRDYIFDTMMILSLMATQFSRIAEDLILWSTKEFDFIEIDEQFCSVSSVMPQKKNPDTIELIRSKSAKVMSNSFGVMMIMKSIPTGYFRDFQDLKSMLRDSLELIKSIINMIKKIFSTIKIKKENMKKAIDKNFIQALDLAELLVQENNIPFRQAHEIIARFLSEIENSKQLWDKEKIDRIIFNVFQKKVDVSTESIDKLKNLDYCLYSRKSQGSPSEKELIIMIDKFQVEKKKLYSSYYERLEKVKNAKIQRENLIQKLIS